MNCLVTGCTGYIGSNLTKRLLAEGHHVIGLVHSTKPPAPAHKNLTYITGDITDVNSLTSSLSAYDFTVVFHCAALVKDYGPKQAFYRVNVEGTRNLISLCKTRNLSRFICLGHIPTGRYSDYYSKTKAAAEQLLLTEYTESQLPVVIIRPGNVYGPGKTLWLLRVFKAIQRDHIALINQGQGIFLHTYIDNLIDALLLAIDAQHACGEILEITDGDNTTTWAEYLNYLSHLAVGKNITRSLSTTSAHLLSRLSMIAYALFAIKPRITPLAVSIFTNTHPVSIEKARRILGYDPKIDLEVGLKKVAQWLKKEGYVDRL